MKNILPFTTLLGNFIKAGLIGGLGFALCSLVIILANSASEPILIYKHYFWQTAAAGGTSFFLASYFVLSFTDDVQKHRSLKANNAYSVFWGLAFLASLGVSGKMFYDYMHSPLRLEAEWRAIHMKGAQQQKICGNNCVRYRGNLSHGPTTQ